MIRFYNNAYSIGLSAGDSVYVNLYYSAGSNQFRAYFENITTGKVLTEIVTPLDGSCVLRGFDGTQVQWGVNRYSSHALAKFGTVPFSGCHARLMSGHAWQSINQSECSKYMMTSQSDLTLTDLSSDGQRFSITNSGS